MGPASHLQNLVQPIDLHLHLSPTHSLTSHPQCIISRTLSGASLVPEGTGLGIRMVPDAILNGSKPYFSGSNFGGRPIIAVFRCATWKCASLMFSAAASFVVGPA